MKHTELLDHLLHVTEVLGTDMQEHLRGLGLTTAKAHLLWILHGEGPSRQRDLAVALGHTPRHVTTLVDELIEAGHVSREPHPHDRRAVLISLTPGAVALIEQMASEHEVLGRQLFGHLDRAARADLGLRLLELQQILDRLTTRPS